MSSSSNKLKSLRQTLQFRYRLISKPGDRCWTFVLERACVRVAIVGAIATAIAIATVSAAVFAIAIAAANIV